jgi:hypothetical protein
MLQEKIAAAAKPPAPRQVPPLPAMATEISGRHYMLEKNNLGLVSIGFTFDGADTALLDLRLADRRESRPVGLDGVYRVSRTSPEGQPVAVKGEWISETELGFTYNEFTEVHNRFARAAFAGDGITLRVSDPYDDLDMTIRGRAGE